MLFGAAIIVVALASVYAVATAATVVKVPVDDGKFLSAAVAGLLLIDFYSDITFAIHLGAHFSATDTGSRRRLADISDEDKFKSLLIAAVVFIIVSYIANIASMVTVLLRVLEDAKTSIYTKRYVEPCDITW